MANIYKKKNHLVKIITFMVRIFLSLSVGHSDLLRLPDRLRMKQ